MLFGELFLAVSSSTLDRIIRESPREARYFAGFAAWEAGELAGELGARRLADRRARRRRFLHPNPDAMWSGLVERIKH